MKKLLFCLYLISISSFVYAGSGKFSVIKGDKNILRENVSATLEIDTSTAMWEGESYEQFCGNDYQERTEGSLLAFTNSFNESSKGLRIANNEQAKYKIIIVVHKYLRKIRTFYKGEVMIWCTINLIDLNTGNECLKIEVEKAGGDTDYTIHEGIYKCFSAMAKRVNNIK